MSVKYTKNPNNKFPRATGMNDSIYHFKDTNIPETEILNDLRQSGAIIYEYESSTVLVRLDNPDQFIIKFKQTKSCNLTSLKKD